MKPDGKKLRSVVLGGIIGASLLAGGVIVGGMSKDWVSAQRLAKKVLIASPVVNHGVLSGQNHAEGDDSLCVGGSKTPLEITVEPVLIESDGAGESLTLDVAVTPHVNGDAQIVTAIEIVNDRGEYFGNTAFGAVIDVLENGKAHRSFKTPKSLPDGFYHISVTAAGVGPESTEMELATQDYYVRIRRGKVRPLSHDRWRKLSNVGLVMAVES